MSRSVSLSLPQAALLLALSMSTVVADQTTTITTTLYPVWDGWGTSLAWWAKAFGDRDDLADIFFTLDWTDWAPGNETLPGLGLNIVRYNAGACSWNTINGSTTMVASPNIPEAKQIPGYWLDGSNTDPSTDSWDWSKDANQRSMMLKAQKRGANVFELFSNSPMWWQLSNFNPSGAENGGDNLLPFNYDEHAIYLATIAKYAQDHWGITFDSIEPFNEPAADWWVATGDQEGCHFDATSQAALVPILRRQMENRDLHNTIISASDESTFDMAWDTWNTIGKDIQKADVGRTNTHGYQGYSGPRYKLQQAARNVGQKVWDSEYGDDDASGDTAITNLMLDIRWLRPNAWVYWQTLDGPGWGLINADIDTGSLSGASHKYFELAHFTRHIRPGMRVLDTDSGNVIPAIDTDANRLVIVAANWEDAQTLAFDLSSFSEVPADGSTVRSWVTDRAGDSLYVRHDDVTIENGRISVEFGKGMMQTFEIDGIEGESMM